MDPLSGVEDFDVFKNHVKEICQSRLIPRVYVRSCLVHVIGTGYANINDFTHALPFFQCLMGTFKMFKNMNSENFLENCILKRQVFAIS